jgi:hypothetical protein
VVYEKNMYVPGSRAVVSYVTNIRLILGAGNRANFFLLGIGKDQSVFSE